MFWWIKLSFQLSPSILSQAFKQCYKPLTQDTLWQPWCASFIFKIILHNLCPHHYNHRRFLLPPSSEKFKVRSPAKLADITHPSLTVTECDVFRFLFFSHQTNTFFCQLVFSQEQLSSHLSGHDAVLSCLGFKPQKPAVTSVSNIQFQSWISNLKDQKPENISKAKRHPSYF